MGFFFFHLSSHPTAGEALDPGRMTDIIRAAVAKLLALPTHKMRHNAGDGGGIDAAGKVEAHRDVSSKAHAHGVHQFFADRLDHPDDRVLVVLLAVVSRSVCGIHSGSADPDPIFI